MKRCEGHVTNHGSMEARLPGRACNEVDPFGGTTGPSFLIGKLAGSDLLDHATQGVCCCCCRGGHVGDAAASSKRSVMSTALPARAPLTPSRHTAIGVRPASA